MKTVNLNGKVFPLRCSLRAVMSIEDKFGTMNAALEAGKTERETTERKTFVLHQLMQAGKVWTEQEEGRESPAVPALEDLPDLLELGAMGRISMAMMEAITADQEHDLGAEAEEKN